MSSQHSSKTTLICVSALSPAVSFILWLAFFGIDHLVNAEPDKLTWTFTYEYPLVLATIDGSISECDGDSTRELEDLTVKLAQGKRVFKHTWKDETKLYLHPGGDLPHTFRLPSNDQVFPLGIPCIVILRVANCDDFTVSPVYTRNQTS